MEPGKDHLHNNLMFVQALEQFDNLLIAAEDVRDDLGALTTAFPDPHQHWQALQAILKQLRILATHLPGKPMKGQLFGSWRRHAFESAPQRRGPADLRIVYRVHDDGTVEVLGFGHRHVPESLYGRLHDRATERR